MSTFDGGVQMETVSLPRTKSNMSPTPASSTSVRRRSPFNNPFYHPSGWIAVVHYSQIVLPHTHSVLLAPYSDAERDAWRRT